MYSVTKEQSLFGTVENETNPHGSTCGEMDSTEHTRECVIIHQKKQPFAPTAQSEMLTKNIQLE